MKKNITDPAGQQLAERIAKAAIEIQELESGHKAESVQVIVVGRTITVTIMGILSPVEQQMAKSVDGAAKVQAFHRELSLHPPDTLRSRIQQIVGLDVKEADGFAEATSETFVKASTGGRRVQVFLLSGEMASETFDDDQK